MPTAQPARDPITDPAASIDDLRAAIAAVSGVGPTGALWLGVAADDRFPPVHRALCVAAFLRLAVDGDATLGRLGDAFDRPGWLGEQDVEAVTVVAGKLPVHWAPGETIAVVHLRFGGAQVGAAYLAVDGALETPELRAVLCRNEGGDETRTTSVLDIGFDAALA